LKEDSVLDCILFIHKS